ncbi:hypothetical protein ILUMI_19743, partial [Ignelater luminosus]
MIPKPDKPPHEVTSYQPMTLLSTISNVFKKLLHKRLKPVIEEKGLTLVYRENKVVDDSENDHEDEVQAFEKNESDEEWLPQPARNSNRYPVDEEVSDVEDVFADANIRSELDSHDEEDIHDIDDVNADEESASDKQVLRGKDNTRPGPVKSTETLSARDVFKCIFSDAMCTIIIKEKSRKVKSVYDKWNAEHPDKPKKTWRELTPEEFDGYLEILVNATVRHSSSEHKGELWKCDAYVLYRAIFPITRFCEISRFIRFDNEKTRARRPETDKAAAITDLWLMLNRNLQSHYVPSECIVIDEQLFPFRGKTETRNQPGRTSRAGFGHLVQKSREKRHYGQLFLHQNKACIPPEMKANTKREPQSLPFRFAEDGKVTMCSYVPKKNKSVILLSTMHSDDSVSGAKNKPKIIQYYNRTKGGVDSMDKMVTHYSTKRRTCRWALAMFYNMIDI